MASLLVKEAVDEGLAGESTSLEDVPLQSLDLLAGQDVPQSLQVQQELVPVATVFLGQVVYCVGQLVIGTLAAAACDVGLQELLPVHGLSLEFSKYFAELGGVEDDTKGAHHNCKLRLSDGELPVGLDEKGFPEFAMFGSADLLLHSEG